MNRRALLVSLAATGGVVGTAGCLQSPGGSGETTVEGDTETTVEGDTETTVEGDTETTVEGDTDTSTADETERTADDETETASDGSEWNPSGEPVATLTVNDRDGLSFPDNNRPHSLVLWNAVDREREVRVEWGDGRTEELERTASVAVPADGLLQVDLLLPTSYDVVVRADGDALGEHAVGRDWFDCNESASRLGLTETDLVDYGVISTAAGCPAPSVADTTLSAGEGDCGTEDQEAAVAGYGDEVVTVDATFVTPDPCHELAIADVAYDGETRTARIVVEATPGGGACVECVGAIDYEATITYEQDFPDRVVVVHRSGDDERRVATAAWNADA
jgi:hypothetical protein